MNSIEDLVNKKQWMDILKLIKEDKVKLKETYENGRNILHIAAQNNVQDILLYLANQDSKLFMFSDDDGNTPLHVLIIGGYYDMVKEIIKKLNPDAYNLTNKNGDTILHLSCKYNNKLFRWLIKNISELDLDMINNAKESILTYNIRKSKSEEDKYFSNIKLLIENKVKTDASGANPLCESLYLKKEYISKYLIDNKVDINIKDNKFMTPLLISIYNDMKDMTKYLIKNKAIINYSGVYGDSNPLILLIMKQQYDLVEYLVDNGFNVNSENRFMETPMHFAMSIKNALPDLIYKFIYYGDLNTQDIKGTSPLHVFVKNHDITNYDEVLKIKKLDIFLEDDQKRTPIYYINADKLDDFMNIVVESYINQLKENKMNDENIKCLDTNNVDCIDLVKTHILTTKRSFPVKIDEHILNYKLLVTGDNAYYGKFNSDGLHNMIYTIELLKKHKNLMIPMQYFLVDKMLSDKLNYNDLNMMITQGQQIISNLVGMYTDFFYEIVPYLVIWKSISENYVCKNL